MKPDLSANRHLQRYFVQLVGIRHRLVILDRLIKMELTTGIIGPDVEFVCLQFRKLIEQVAMISLIAHVDEYAQAQLKFSTQWNAKKILKEIEQINPNYYPVPARLKIDERGAYVDPIVNRDYLTKDDFLELYQTTSSVIHAENPFTAKVKSPHTIHAAFKKWYEKVYTLIVSHVVMLYQGEYVFYGEIFSANGMPHVQLLNKNND